MRNARQKGQRGWREERIVSFAYFTSVTKCTHCYKQSRRWDMRAVVYTHPVSLYAHPQCHATIVSVIVALYTASTINVRNANVIECNGRLRRYPTCIKSRSSRYRAYCWGRLGSHATRFDLGRWPKGLRIQRIIPHELIKNEYQNLSVFHESDSDLYLVLWGNVI